MSPDPVEGPKIRALLVEDDPVSAQMLRTLLGELDTECVVADTGELGWETFQRTPFPLVILDWMLPGMDGLELCRRIRHSPSGNDCVILMITGRDRTGDLIRVLEAGADDYLSKPVETGLLRVRLIIARSRVRQLALLAEARMALQRAREQLELRVQQRTAELAVANDTLRLEIQERARVESALREREVRERAILLAALDGIITMDPDGRIMEFNPAAEGIFGHKRASLLGLNMVDTLIPERLRDGFRRRLDEHLSSGDDGLVGRRVEMPALRVDGTEILLELAVVRVGLEGGTLYTGFVRDITLQRHAEVERQRLSQEREEALYKIKILSGMLPMCSACKKIRDDRGVWNELEDYLSQHSAASVTHGLCPSCAQQLYPSIFGRK